MTRALATCARLAVVAMTVVAAACTADPSSDASGARSTSTSTTTPAIAIASEDRPDLPVTVRGADGVEVTVNDVSRIIPVNGDLAEVVFALGLGDEVVATDRSATYPPEADALPEIGYQRSLVAEQVLGHDPTVVLANTDAGPPGVIDQLRATGVPVVVLGYPDDLAGPAAKIRAVAAALGVPGRGEHLVADVEQAIATATTDATARVTAAGGQHPRAVFLYLRGQNVQQIGGAGSGVDALLAAAGAIDVGTELGVDEFTPLTDESLIAARPDVVVVTTAGLESVGGVDGLVATPAIAATPAGQNRRVIAIDDQLLLGLGPRTGEALRALADGLHRNN